MSASAGIVSDPFRAADVKWPKHECMGRTWRYLLEPAAFSMNGLKDEAFVQDAGVYPITPPSTLHGDRAGKMFEFSDDPNAKRFVVSEPTIPSNILARIKDHPFQFYEASRCHMGLKHEECDLRVYDRFVKEYPDTYLGCCFGEWNSRVIYFLPRKQSAHYKDFVREFPLPWTRDGFYRNFLAYWDMAAGQKGPRVWGMSGPCNLTAIGVERGSTTAALEITCDGNWRELMMFTYGAGRQFDVPLQYYIALFLGGVTANANPDDVRTGMGEDWGIPPNLVYRTVMLGYYMGCNYQTFECFPWGFAKGHPTDWKTEKKVVLTGNGRAAKRAYEFIRSPAGERGEFYAPILFLVDRAHGHDGLCSSPSVKTGEGVFSNEFPPTAADQFMEDVLGLMANRTRGVQPYERDGKVNPVAEYQYGLYNSPFADIFDVAIANPVTPGKELRLDQLEKYPVVFSMGGIQWDQGLIDRLAAYVEQGGTFVAPAGEMCPVKKSGLGNVVSAPREPEKLREFMLQLQREVLPCSYRGECESVWNVMPDGSWRVCLVNNAGVSKLVKGTEETFHKEFTKTVTFALPNGATAKELMTGKTGNVVTLPPGEVRVLEIKGLEKHALRTARASRADAEGRAREGTSTTEAAPKKVARLIPPFEFPIEEKFKKYGLYNEVATFREDWESDEITIEVMAKPQPKEYWAEMWKKEQHPPQGGVFGVCGSVYMMFSIMWWNNHWWVREGWGVDSWIGGPEADPSRYTKLAVTLKDKYLHFFVDDKEVFTGKGAKYWEIGTTKDLFNHCFCFHRGSDNFMDSSKHYYLGEAKDYHAYSEAVYPLRYVVEKKVENAGGDVGEKLPEGFERFDGDAVGKVAMKAKAEGADDTATIQKTIDAAVEKTGEVVLRKGSYKVSQLQLRTGVTLHLEEGASIVQSPTSNTQPLLLAKDITDFAILGKGTVEGDVLFENVDRGCVRRLKMADGKLIVKSSKNIVFEDCATVTIDNQGSSRILVDGKLLTSGRNF